MHVTTRLLAPLASELTGKKVAVFLGHELPWSVGGIASHDGSQFTVHLHPSLFSYAKRGELAYYFLHECGHIAKGHTPVRKVKVSSEQIVHEAKTVDDSGFRATRISERFEREAHDWAWEHVDDVPAWRVWKLVTKE